MKKTRLKVLHLPTNPCGQPALSCRALRLLGQEAKFYCVKSFHPRFQYEYGPDFYQKYHGTWGRRFELLYRLASFPMRFDVFHYHDASSLLPEEWKLFDAKLFRKMGRKVIVEFWGSDVRNPEYEEGRNPFYINSYSDNAARSDERLKRWAEVTNGHVVYGDHSLDEMLRPYFQHIHVIPQRIDTSFFSPVFPNPETKVPVIVHAPSQKAFKGTKFVKQAIENLKKKKLRFEYIEVFGLPQKEAVKVYRTADLIIDQLCVGSHGVFAVEAMALGKPVVCYILPELIPTYPAGFPIVNANPDNLESVLENWIQNPTMLHVRGRESREYAERVHSLSVVGESLVSVYKSL